MKKINLNTNYLYYFGLYLVKKSSSNNSIQCNSFSLYFLNSSYTYFLKIKLLESCKTSNHLGKNSLISRYNKIKLFEIYLFKGYR